MKKDRIPEALKQQVERELLAGERLLWAGQPAPVRFALRKNPELSMVWSRVITGIMLTLTVLMFIFSGVTNSASAVWLATALLVLTVIAAVVSDLLERYRQARRTVYAVTDRRAFTYSPRGIRSHMPDDLKTIKRVNHTRQMGDVIFGHQSRRRMIWLFMSIREVEPIGFFNVRYPEQLEALLLETFHPGEVFIESAQPESVPSFSEERQLMEEENRRILSG